MFSNVEDMGSDSGDDNHMDALLENTAERRDTGRSIKFEPSQMEKIALADNNDPNGITSNRIATKLDSGSLPKPPISTKSGLP